MTVPYNHTIIPILISHILHLFLEQLFISIYIYLQSEGFICFFFFEQFFFFCILVGILLLIRAFHTHSFWVCNFSSIVSLSSFQQIWHFVITPSSIPHFSPNSCTITHILSTLSPYIPYYLPFAFSTRGRLSSAYTAISYDETPYPWQTLYHAHLTTYILSS